MKEGLKVHKKLFIPGPVEVRTDVLDKMATPMIGHRSKDASALQHRISDKIQQLFYTDYHHFIVDFFWQRADGRSGALLYPQESSSFFDRRFRQTMV